MKIQFVIYAHTESLLEKIPSCNNNVESKTKYLRQTNSGCVLIHYSHTVYLTKKQRWFFTHVIIDQTWLVFYNQNSKY